MWRKDFPTFCINSLLLVLIIFLQTTKLSGRILRNYSDHIPCQAVKKALMTVLLGRQNIKVQSVTFSGETLINLDPHAYVAGWVPRDWIKTNITRENSARKHFPYHRVVIPVSLKYLKENKVSMLPIRQSITLANTPPLPPKQCYSTTQLFLGWGRRGQKHSAIQNVTNLCQ